MHGRTAARLLRTLSLGRRRAKMANVPRVVTCRGATPASQLAAAIARVLAAEGVTGPPLDLTSADDPRGEGPFVALDGCASACGSRAASARGLPLAARVTLRDLGVVDVPFDTVDVVARARRVLSRAERARQPTPLGRPRWGRPGQPPLRARRTPPTTTSLHSSFSPLRSSSVERSSRTCPPSPPTSRSRWA